MAQISYQLPTVGQPNSTEDGKITTALQTLLNAINGGLDATNVAAALAQSASVNQASQTVKGAVNIATSQSTSSTTYTTLATPDQVTGLVLPANGLIRVWYQATWQESVAGAASAAIFLGANQLRIPAAPASNAVAAAGLNESGGANVPTPLSTYPGGLNSPYNYSGTGYPGDVTTGQAVISASGGPCDIFAAAGTYTVSVQFKASSGSVTASNRRLWVQALSFA